MTTYLFNMAQINTEYIIKALQLPRIGRKTAFKLFDNLNFRISSDDELYDFICENSEKFRLPEYSSSDFERALKNYEEIEYANQKNGIKTISFYDDKYPELYKTIVDKPIVLNFIGDISNLNEMPSVAVIGTREPSESGAKAAIRFGEIFGEKGFNVVSGLAIGCDAGGHIGCLNKKGFTSSILAHGLDHIYPKENKPLADKILEGGGVLISEYFVGQKPLANYFVERDRLQAGLSNGIIVVETDIKGGTMHTVKFAKENNRRIAAFAHGKPELLIHPKTQGNQMLIREGTAISLGSLDEIENYAQLLKDDHEKRITSNVTTSKQNENLPKDGTQLNMFG
jgi:DNA processing protein